MERDGKDRISGRVVFWAATAAVTLLVMPALAGVAIVGHGSTLHDHGAALPGIVQQPFYLGSLAMRALNLSASPAVPIYVFAHVLLGMWAIDKLLRRLVSGEGAAIAAAIFGLCGMTLADFSSPHWICAAAWMPVVLLAFDDWAIHGGMARGALLAVSLPQPLVAGDPLGAALLAVAGVCWAGLRRRRPAATLALEGLPILLVAALIASPQLWISLQALGGAGLPREVREQWPLHPARLAQLFVPRLSLAAPGSSGGFTVSPPWHRTDLQTVYSGLIGPALVAVALWRRRRHPFVWASLAVIVLLTVLGQQFAPYRVTSVFVILWAVLAAVGAASIVELRRSTRVGLALGTAGLALGVLGTSAWLTPFVDPWAVRACAAHVVTIGFACAAALALQPRLAQITIGLVLIGDLGMANGELLRLLPRGSSRSPLAVCGAPTPLDAGPEARLWHGLGVVPDTRMQ
jgi:hypothetical protein